MPHMGSAMPHMGSAMPGMGNPKDRRSQLQLAIASMGYPTDHKKDFVVNIMNFAINSMSGLSL